MQPIAQVPASTMESQADSRPQASAHSAQNCAGCDTTIPSLGPVALSYKIWQTARQDFFDAASAGEKIRSFPLRPTHSCKCYRPRYKPKKNSIWLMACRYETEKRSRSSGWYSEESLKKERSKWHPDLFTNIADRREEDLSVRVAIELFRIIEDLISRC